LATQVEARDVSELTPELLRELMVEQDMTLQAVGDRYGVTRAYIGQIAKRFGGIKRRESWWTGDQIRMLRERYGLKQFQMARLLDVADKTESGYETGTIIPKVETCRRLDELEQELSRI
jgi:transcriptional regulator with XRE-family HTH domain